MNKLQILQSLGSTELMKGEESKNIFSRIVEKAFDSADSEEEEKVAGAIALKYDLNCLSHIVDSISQKGFTMPWDNS